MAFHSEKLKGKGKNDVPRVLGITIEQVLEIKLVHEGIGTSGKSPTTSRIDRLPINRDNFSCLEFVARF